MLNRIRRLKDHRDGQAIVLAAVGLLVLAIGVLATINLGHAIHERIRLQNTADAAAYSMAALEARAFNFFAFTNRAAVSHYVSMMSLQSWLAMIWFIDMVLGTLADLCSEIQFIACVCCRGACLIFFELGCLVEGIAAAAHNALRAAHRVFRQFANGADKVLGKAIQYMPEVNRFGLYATQMLMRGMVLANVALSGKDIVKANDPEIDYQVWDILTGGLNALEFDSSIDDSASMFKLPDPDASGDTLGAMRVMTEISNATRYPDFISNRSLSNILSSIPGIGAIAGRLLELAPIKIDVTGQTKMTTVVEKCGWSPGCRGQKRFGTQIDHSQLGRGNVIAADEVMTISVNIINIKEFDVPLPQDYVSVWASTNGDGEHCAHDNIDVPTFICQDFYITWPKCYGDDENHKWKGIQPYAKFKPDSSHATFNQPSVYVMLNKSPEKLGGQAYQENFTFTNGPRAEEIDTTIGKEPLLGGDAMAGLNAWARGMAYYHRPSFRSGESNWREHPNFFNPFWRAKLAPIGEKVNEWVGQLGISGEFANYFTRELITH
ncbi:MAG TPA: pilus assembly protein TadG-related protein [Myxococcota bacterium]|nr:pilus assembly protein TadG-related protein [Myxococcota bacterium]HRY94471.1 pilus assembly protein TadG-related protein [Myxococcota bacterium]